MLYAWLKMKVYADESGWHFRPNAQRATSMPESPAYSLNLILSERLAKNFCRRTKGGRRVVSNRRFGGVFSPRFRHSNTPDGAPARAVAERRHTTPYGSARARSQCYSSRNVACVASPERKRDLRPSVAGRSRRRRHRRRRGRRRKCSTPRSASRSNPVIGTATRQNWSSYGPFTPSPHRATRLDGRVASSSSRRRRRAV